MIRDRILQKTNFELGVRREKGVTLASPHGRVVPVHHVYVDVAPCLHIWTRRVLGKAAGDVRRLRGVTMTSSYTPERRAHIYGRFGRCDQ